MSLKDRLTAEKEAALNYDNIAKQVEAILIQAAKDGKSSFVILLEGENDDKTKAVRKFLTQEGLEFRNSYDVYTTTQLPYIDTHMGGYEGVDPNKPVAVTKQRFQGIRVFI